MGTKLAAVVVVLDGAVLAAVGQARAAFPGQNGLIAIDNDRDGDHDIYVVRPDGRVVAKLTRTRASDFSPVWSPSGRRLAFVSDRDGDEEIYVMRADGTKVRQVTRNAGIADNAPAWSTAWARGTPSSSRFAPTARASRGSPSTRAASTPPTTTPSRRGRRTGSGSTTSTTMPARPTSTRLTRTGAISPSSRTRPSSTSPSPRLSPNGRRLLYASLSFDVPWTIRIADAEGKEPAALRRGFFADWQRVPD